MMRKRRSHRRSGSLTYIKKEKKFKIGILYEILSWFFGCVVAIFLGVVLVYAFGTRCVVTGSSMEPNLSNGQEVLLNRFAFQFTAPKQGDVIAFRPNGNENAHISIKRVIATPGSTIRIMNGKVYIDGEEFFGDYADDTQDPGIAEEEILLGPDEYFVMGDNRQNSEDSRNANIGNVSRNMIEGKCWYHLKSDKAGNGKVE